MKRIYNLYTFKGKTHKATSKAEVIRKYNLPVYKHIGEVITLEKNVG